jgi:phosphoesterase RecJ-like protein
MAIIPFIQQLLTLPRRVVITMHTQPDADAVGAALGLANFLKKDQHQVSIIAPTKFPNFLDWLPGREEIIVYQESEHALASQLIANAEIIFCVDFSLLSRIPEIRDLVEKSAAHKIVIDHHIDPVDFTNLAICDPKAAASTELIYELITRLEKKSYLDKKIAECLYVGIVTDTNSFKNPNSTARVHRIAADLLEYQIDIAKINKFIYDNNSLKKLKFLGFALNKRLVVRQEWATAYFVIQQADVRRFQLELGDTEGLVNYALSLQGIVLAALMKEKKDGVSFSFRSIGEFPVNKLAREYFEGGGHKNAAGGISRLPLLETIAKFEKIVQAESEKKHFTKNQLFYEN